MPAANNRSEVGGPDCWEDYEYNQQLMWVKVPLVLGFGSALSVISILENIYLSYLFATYPIFRTSHMFYMAVLAVIDIFVNINYLLLMALPILYEKTLSLFLYHAWITYVMPMLAASLACITVGTYLVVAATLERYLKAIDCRQTIINLVEQHRPSIVVGIFVFALLLRGSRYFELQIIHISDCNGTFVEYSLRLANWLQDNFYYSVIFGFYIRNIFHVLLPFICLLYMNLTILHIVRKGISNKSSAAHQGNQQTAAAARQLKDCTRMLMSVVSMYLASNLLYVVVTVWEMVDSASLDEFETFYTLFNDIVSLMTILCTALRLPVYYACNRAIRTETKRVVLRLLGRKLEPSLNSTLTTCDDGSTHPLLTTQLGDMQKSGHPFKENGDAMCTSKSLSNGNKAPMQWSNSNGVRKWLVGEDPREPGPDIVDSKNALDGTQVNQVQFRPLINTNQFQCIDTCDKLYFYDVQAGTRV